MRFAALLATLIATLLGSPGSAVAAADWAPRMERVGACSWDSPGHNPFMGDVVAAIDRYSEIPTPVRMRLKQRMQARQYDDLVDIRRDQISGRHRYEPAIRDMHFGLDRVCRQVTRQRWTAQMHERGLVYCEQGHCILVPTVCRNVSRIERRPTEVAGATAGESPPAASSAAAPPVGASVASLQSLPAEPAPPGPQATSSFAEAVAGAVVPLWPIGDALDPPGARLSTLRDTGPIFVSVAGPGNGGGGLPPYAGTAGSLGGNGPPSDGGSPGGSHGGPLGGAWPSEGPGIDGGTLPISPVPEPATWASLLAGLLALAGVSARRKARR